MQSDDTLPRPDRPQRGGEVHRSSDVGLPSSAEAKFRALVTASSDAVYRMSPDWSEMRELVGREFIVGTDQPSRTWLQKYIHPDDQARVLAAIDEAVRTRTVFELEHRVLRVDGSLGWTLSRAVPMIDATGEVVEWFGMASDITARKQAEEALRETERRYRDLIRQAPAGIYELDFRTRRFVSVNDAMCEMLGYSRDELVAMDPFEILDEEGRTRFQERIRVWLGGEEPERDVEYRVKARDGRTLDVVLNVTFTKGEDGRPRGATVIGHDITVRKRAEEAHAASRQQLQAIIDNTPAIVYAFDLDERFIMANAALAHMLNSTPAEVVGKRRHELMPKEDADWHEANDRQVVEAGRALEFEEYSQLGGRSITWLTTKFPLRDAQGQIYAVAGISADISRRKQADDALREANLRLADADRRKNEFIAILSHELRNPLAPIRYALPLLGEERLGEGARRAVAVIDRQVGHLTRLVDDLLDVSRITTGKIELQTDFVTLAAVLTAAVESASPAIAAAQHSLDVAVPDAPIWLHVDATRISQAVTNLLNNSAKYTPKGGRIRLEATASDGQLVIRVADNGIGISPDALPAVFDMFRQGDTARTSQGGLGIGLTLTQRLVEMHGGTVEAHSAGLNQGAEFVIRLPIAPAVNAPDERQLPGPSGQATRLRVLVVDDNVDLVDMLAMVVETAGHDVRKAIDGRSAISAALEYRPHVILLDIGMPGMDGMEVARELRRHVALASTRIVALTGWGQPEDRRRTAEAGFDDHLTKPADAQHVQRILEEVAGRLSTASGTV